MSERLLHARRQFGAALVCSLATLAAVAETEIHDAPASGAELGLGWDDRSSSLIANRCVQFAPVQESGQEVSLTLSEVSGSEELREHLGISASAAVHGIAGSGSVSAEFAENSSVKSSSKNFAVHASISNGVMFAGPHRPPAPRRDAFSAMQVLTLPIGVEPPEPPSEGADTLQLLPWVINAIKDGTEEERLSKFQRLCGTHFVSAIYSGVEMFSVVTATTTDVSKERDIKAAISASYGVGAVDAAAEKSLNSNLQQANAQMSFLQRGGAGGIVPSSHETTLQKLDVIAQEAMEAPEFFDIAVTEYSDLWNWPLKTKYQPDEQSDLVVRRYFQLKTFYRDLQAVIDNLRVQEDDKQLPPADDDNPSVANYDTCFDSAHYEILQDQVRTLLRVIESAQATVIDANWNYGVFKLPKSVSFDEIASLGSIYSSEQSTSGTDPIALDSLLLWLEHNLPVAYLRAHLPPLQMENTSLCAEKSRTETNRRNYQARVMQQYVRHANTRLCGSRSRDIDCLSNVELNNLQSAIPYPLVQLDIKNGAVGYLCSETQHVPLMCVAKSSSSGHQHMTGDRSEAALVTFVEKTPGSYHMRIAAAKSGAADSGLKVGSKAAESGGKDVMYLDTVVADGSAELLWRVVKRHAGYPGVRLQEATRGKYCLLDRSGGLLLTYQNECRFTKNQEETTTSRAYAWTLVDPKHFSID